MTSDPRAITDIFSAFLPNRAYRRQMAGARCFMCGLGIVAVDLALAEVEVGGIRTDARPIHAQCTALIAEQLAALRGEAADDGDSEPERVADSPEAG